MTRGSSIAGCGLSICVPASRSAIRDPHRALPGRRFFSLVLSFLLPAILLSGCGPSQAELDRASADLVTARREGRRLRGENEKLQQQVTARDQRIKDLMTLGPKRLDRLFHVRRIELGKYTGGVDLDDKPGHDGIRVYLTPIDQAGHTIKAAGRVKVELFDLANPPDRNLLGRFEWSTKQASGNWVSFVVYHYSLTCPWPSRPPEHNEITVRVEFLDYLTGARFTAQKLCKVSLPPLPASRPANP